MCGLLSIAENAMVILQPARDTRRYRRQSPVTLWHGWRGNLKNFQKAPISPVYWTHDVLLCVT